MKQIIFIALVVIGTIFFPVAALATSETATDSTSSSTGGSAIKQSIKRGINEIGGGSSADIGSVVKTIINFLLFLIGVVAVIMIIYGGIQYTLSAGDAGKLTSAKNTIIYSIIGLVVAILAYALVNFVIKAFTG